MRQTGGLALLILTCCLSSDYIRQRRDKDDRMREIFSNLLTVLGWLDQRKIPVNHSRIRLLYRFGLQPIRKWHINPVSVFTNGRIVIFLWSDSFIWNYRFVTHQPTTGILYNIAQTCSVDGKFDWEISTTVLRSKVRGSRQSGAAVRLMNVIFSPSLNECELFLPESQSESTTVVVRAKKRNGVPPPPPP